MNEMDYKKQVFWTGFWLVLCILGAIFLNSWFWRACCLGLSFYNYNNFIKFKRSDITIDDGIMSCG